jgi:hypothetical protein
MALLSAGVIRNRRHLELQQLLGIIFLFHASKFKLS